MYSTSALQKLSLTFCVIRDQLKWMSPSIMHDLSKRNKTSLPSSCNMKVSADELTDLMKFQ